MFAAANFLQDHFSTPEGVVNALLELGIVSPSLDTVRRWFYRDAVPAGWLVALFASIQHRGGQLPRMTIYLDRGSDDLDIFN